jgi:hypothetical protein
MHKEIEIIDFVNNNHCNYRTQPISHELRMSTCNGPVNLCIDLLYCYVGVGFKMRSILSSSDLG